MSNNKNDMPKSTKADSTQSADAVEETHVTQATDESLQNTAVPETVEFAVTFEDDDTAEPAVTSDEQTIDEDIVAKNAQYTNDMLSMDTRITAADQLKGHEESAADSSATAAATRLDRDMKATNRNVNSSVFKTYPVYSFQNVTLTERKSGAAVLDNISFECHAGQAYAIVVPNNAPLMHTMLLSVMTGMTLPSSGHVMSKSTSLDEISPSEIRGYRMGLVMPQFLVREDLSAEANLLYAMDASSRNFLNPKPVVARDLLKQVEFGKDDDNVTSNGTKAKDLNMLNKLRVSVARAISRDPDIVIADEPCAMLSGDDCETIIRLLKAQTHAHSKNRTVIVVTEDPQIANKVGNVIDLR